MEKIKYFAVKTKCGHVGRSYYTITFAIKAQSAKEAAKIARQIPRVKHDHKDAILNVTEITHDDYNILSEINYNDDYLKCNSKHEQKRNVNLEDRIVPDPHYVYREVDQEIRRERINFKKKKESYKLSFESLFMMA